nr:unnamed protein product [Callosobruchus chinensis]
MAWLFTDNSWEEGKDMRERDMSVVADWLSEIYLTTIISEVSERAKRKKNLMIFGVDEQGPDGDKNAVNEILKSVERNIDLRDVKPVRLGRQVEGRRRPIKISWHV